MRKQGAIRGRERGRGKPIKKERVTKGTREGGREREKRKGGREGGREREDCRADNSHWLSASHGAVGHLN